MSEHKCKYQGHGGTLILVLICMIASCSADNKASRIEKKVDRLIAAQSHTNLVQKISEKMP